MDNDDTGLWSGVLSVEAERRALAGVTAGFQTRVPVCSICWFLWCECFRHGRFRATNMTSPSAVREGHVQSDPADSSAPRREGEGAAPRLSREKPSHVPTPTSHLISPQVLFPYREQSLLINPVYRTPSMTFGAGTFSCASWSCI